MAVGVFVDPDGRPVTVRVLESSGYAVLDTAAYQFAKSLTFHPAVIDEKPIGSWTRLVLKYKLTDVVFNKEKWINDAIYLQKKIAASVDSNEKARNQRRLYVHYLGLLNYSRKTPDLDLNYTIKRVIQKSTFAQWRDFWPLIVSPFALFDDFLQQYPEAPIAENVKEELVRTLIEAEGNIRTRALKSRKIAIMANELIEKIETRLYQVQNQIHPHEHNSIDPASPAL